MVPLREEHLGFLPIWGREKQNVLGIAFDVKRKFSDLSRKKIEHHLRFGAAGMRTPHWEELSPSEQTRRT